MKILIVDILDYNNPFVIELSNELKKLNNEVIADVDLFWFSKENNFDIIHFQWPEAAFKWAIPTNIEIKYFTERILFWKKKSKIVYTRHNNKPHYNTNKNVISLYNIIEKYADGIIHLGNFSKKETEKIYNNQIHKIVEHHVYNHVYSNPMEIDKKTARAKLNIKDSKFVMLSFGAFRANEEKQLILNSFLKAKIPNKLLLAPRLELNDFKIPSIWRYPDKWIKEKIKNAYYKNKGVFIVKNNFVPPDILPYYFIASDVIIIQRMKILNSGNIPMAFWFKKAVIGPETGNTTELLKKTNNFIFNPKSNNDLSNQMENAYNIRHKNIGLKNYKYAINNLLTEYCVRKYNSLYNELYNTN